MATTKKKTAMVDGEEIALPVCGSDGEPVKFALIGCDSNAFSVIAGVAKAMRRAGVKREVIDAYKAESTSGNYDHVMQITSGSGWLYVLLESGRLFRGAHALSDGHARIEWKEVATPQVSLTPCADQLAFDQSAKPVLISAGQAGQKDPLPHEGGHWFACSDCSRLLIWMNADHDGSPSWIGMQRNGQRSCAFKGVMGCPPLEVGDDEIDRNTGICTTTGKNACCEMRMRQGIPPCCTENIECEVCGKTGWVEPNRADMPWCCSVDCNTNTGCVKP